MVRSLTRRFGKFEGLAGKIALPVQIFSKGINWILIYIPESEVRVFELLRLGPGADEFPIRKRVDLSFSTQKDFLPR